MEEKREEKGKNQGERGRAVGKADRASPFLWGEDGEESGMRRKRDGKQVGVRAYEAGGGAASLAQENPDRTASAGSPARAPNPSPSHRHD